MLHRCFPQHYAAASLKPGVQRSPRAKRDGFPQHYAAASLKRLSSTLKAMGLQAFSAALRCGLIEANAYGESRSVSKMFSAALRCGLIEARFSRNAAPQIAPFSAALRCGLIEARCAAPRSCWVRRFPQHYAAASLKHSVRGGKLFNEPPVFRSITLRPH